MHARERHSQGRQRQKQLLTESNEDAPSGRKTLLWTTGEPPRARRRLHVALRISGEARMGGRRIIACAPTRRRGGW